MAENSSRIIEKDIFAATPIDPDQSGESEVIDLFGEAGRTSKLSCQAIYTVPVTPGAKDFDSPSFAALTNQGLTYTAVTSGAAGNNISIELIDNGIPSQPLDVNVVGDAIAVTLEIGAGDNASLTNQGLTYTAQDPGVSGNDISIELIDNMTPGQPLAVNVVGDAIAVTLEYDDGAKASLVDQGLTYTAQNIGVAGNDISVELVDTGVADQALEVNVVGDAISVNLELNAGTIASLEVQDITYYANDPGVAGNDITFSITAAGGPGSDLEIVENYPEVDIAPAGSPALYASVVIQDITYTAVNIGSAGNNLNITYVNDPLVTPNAGEYIVWTGGDNADWHMVSGASTAQSLYDALQVSGYQTLVEGVITGNPLTAQVAVGATFLAGGDDGGAPISTADEIAAAINAYGGGFINAVVTGTGSNVQDPFDFVFLAGGLPPQIISTANDVKAAINADVSASALVVVTGAGGAPLTALSPTNLSGGADAAIISTANDVKAAVNADGAASALVLVTGAGASPLIALAETNLSGGSPGGVVSTANDVKAAVNADVAAAALVLVTGAGATPLAAIAETNLFGGQDGEVNVGASELDIASHGFTTGLKVRLTTTGVLPAPLALMTDYFVIVVDANTIQLASTHQNALDGIFIVLTNAGSGIGTVSPVSTSGFVTFQASNNAVIWDEVQAPTSITATGSTICNQPDASYRYFKAVKTVSAGQFDLQGLILVIGPACEGDE